MTGPRVRTDLITAFVVRPKGSSHDVMQLRRTREPMHGSWQPVMGKIEAGERAIEAAVRELGEETSLERAHVAGFWQLERVQPFLLSERDEVFLSPAFLALVADGWEPTLNDEHDGHRWVPLAEAQDWFLWPSQWTMLAECRVILRDGSSLGEALRREPPTTL